MSIKTGYFRGVKKSHHNHIVSIAAGQPKWLPVQYKHKQLAPRYVLLNDFRNDKITEHQYVQQFNAMLSQLNAQQVYNQLADMSGNAIMCCHCGINDFCHRHLVAEWLEHQLGIKIEEHAIGYIVRSNGRVITQPPPTIQGTLW